MLTVTKNPDGSGGFVNVSVSDVWYLKYDRHLDKLIVYTEKDVYYAPGTARYWELALNDAGYPFFLIDRGTLANVNNIVEIDPNYCKAYFNNDRSQPCMMAHHKMRNVISELTRINPNISIA